uniref:Uncharacterized protein n=1 Tax=Anguilla anguilla TaxID=7936 RepID=A0A0E9SLV3_ANGAN
MSLIEKVRVDITKPIFFIFVLRGNLLKCTHRPSQN